MNELVKIDKQQASPWQTFANDTLASAIAGDLLLYRKGEWSRGEDDRPVPLGTRLLVNRVEIWEGWVRWWDGNPAEFRISRLIDNAPKLAREDLGLTDETLWPANSDGKSRDPWQPVYRIVMRDQEGVLLTFSTSSWGGRKAVAKLCRDYDRNAAKHRCGEFPCVELGSRPPIA